MPPQRGVADGFEPAFKPRKHFETLPRETYALVMQARTGHAFIGEYYDRFVPSEDTHCPCGEETQTRIHIIQECERFEAHRDGLRKVSKDLKMSDILGTHDGIDALATFIKRTGALKRPVELTLPSIYPLGSFHPRRLEGKSVQLDPALQFSPYSTSELRIPKGLRA